MTLSVSTQVNPVGSKLIKETSAAATAENNVTGAAGTLYTVDIDNTLNVGTAAYLKIYDSAAPVIGTSSPDLIFCAKAGVRRSYVIPHGWAFSALSFACVTTGGTAGATSPAMAVPVAMVAD